jgi:hypothetical protein
MKKLNRYLSIFALVVVSGTPLLNKPVIATEAALTAPASFDYAYTWNTTESEWGISGVGGSLVPFTRTTGGGYFDYTTTISRGSLNPNVPEGLSITMTFNRSNTSWYQMGGEFAGKYEPSQSKIGSDNTVGTIGSKASLTFNNETNKNYLLTWDISSTPSDFFLEILYDSNNTQILSTAHYSTGNALKIQYIPSYTTFIFRFNSTSQARYFDAWYLKDLGVSDAYDAGYDQGESDGYEDGYNNSVSPLWDGVELTVGVILNFVLFIMTLSVFDISLLSIGVVLLSVLSLVWILKALRG